MDPAEVDLNRISQQLALAAVQATAAYNQAQSRLDLAHVLDGERLVTVEGIADSRRTVSELATLTNQHKEMFSKFITGATSQLLAAAQQIAESKRTEFVESMKVSLNRNLVAQGRFYESRERWIDAAIEALNLAEEHEGDIWLEDGGLVFSTTELLERFRALVSRMDAVRDEEVALLKERQSHIEVALARMNPKPGAES